VRLYELRLGEVRLCLTKRGPFGVLAEGLVSDAGRDDCPSLEPSPQAIGPFVELFVGPLDPHILTVKHLAQHSV